MVALPAPGLEYQGVHCHLRIARPGSGIVLVVLEGSDIGEFGDLPMLEIARDFDVFGSIELFIDARAVRGASIEVSSTWAFWLASHRSRLSRVNMLTGSRYIEITAAFVRRFSGLAGRMRLFTNGAAFDETLDQSVQWTRAA